MQLTTYLLKTSARTDNRPSMSKRFERIQLLLDWLETEFANPAIGLAEMSRLLEIGERQLNEKFRELYGLTDYAYSQQDWTVRKIGEAFGFRDASQFVATFRSLEGMTPDFYRKLHGG